MDEQRFCPIISKDSPMPCKKNCEFYDQQTRRCIFKNLNENCDRIYEEQDRHIKHGIYNCFGWAIGTIITFLIVSFLLSVLFNIQLIDPAYYIN